MELLTCQVVIIDDANVNDRLGMLAMRVRAVLASAGDPHLALADGPSWPPTISPRSVVAFVHWSLGGAELLARDLKADPLVRPDYGERIAAIVAYRGEGSPLIGPVMARLGLAPKTPGGLYPLATATGREIPVLALPRPVVSGTELDQELIQELLAWACSRDGAGAWRLPMSIMPPETWRRLARMLLELYLSARSPDRFGAPPAVAKGSADFRERVLQPEFWSPLAHSFAPPGPGAADRSGPPAVASVLERLRSELGLPPRGGAGTLSADECDEEVWQLWSELERHGAAPRIPDR